MSEAYKLWQGYLVQLPRHTKYTLGTKIDSLFIDCIELALLAGYSTRENKSAVLQKLNSKFDALKFFLKVLWEIKGLNNQKYISLGQLLVQIGKMIGGWTKFC